MQLLDPSVFRAVVDSLTMGVYIVDRDRRVAYWNDGAEKISGYFAHEVVGRCCRNNILAHCDEHNAVLCEVGCPLTETMMDGHSRECSLFLKHKDGYRVPIRVYTLPIRNEKGEIIGAIESFHQQRFVPKPDRRQAHLLACGALDELTGVADHGFTLSVLEQRLHAFSEHFADLGLFSILPDNLQQCRTNRGREAAEGILRVVAQSLQHTLRPTDHLGRWSEDQFLVILPNCGGDSIAHVGERVRSVLRSCAILWWGDKLPISASIGATIARPGDTAETIVMRAERALERSTAAGGDRVTVLYE